MPLYKLNQQQYRFAFTDPVPENRDEKRQDRESGLSHGYITINEAREDIGKAPIEGGDVLLIPANMIPLSMAGQVVNTLPQPAKVDENEDQGEDGNKPQGGNKDDNKEDEDENDDNNQGKKIKKFHKKGINASAKGSGRKIQKKANGETAKAV